MALDADEHEQGVERNEKTGTTNSYTFDQGALRVHSAIRMRLYIPILIAE